MKNSFCADISLLTKKMSDEEFFEMKKILERCLTIKDENCARYLCGDYSVKIRGVRFRKDDDIFGTNDPKFVQMLLDIRKYLVKGNFDCSLCQFDDEAFVTQKLENPEYRSPIKPVDYSNYRLVFKNGEWYKKETVIKEELLSSPTEE